MIIVDYKKNILFPESKKAHYAVCVAVEGDELVILVPKRKKRGRFTLLIQKRFTRAWTLIQSLSKGKGAILFFAPEGTTAYHRITESLIYADPSLYKDLSNKLRKELYKLTEKKRAC